RSASRPIDNSGSDDRSKCVNFAGDDVGKGAALGAFQNFAVVRPGQQIFFARDVDQRETGALRALWQRAFGMTYSPGGALLLIDVGPPAVPKGPVAASLKKVVRF